MTGAHYDVAVVGVDRAEERLIHAGITNVATLDDCDLGDAVFDEADHTWVLPTCRARIVVSNQMRSGREDVVPYLGVAMHGVPNYFTVVGDDSVADARIDYIAALFELMQRTGSTRIEVLFSSQRMFHNRRAGKADPEDPSYWSRMREFAPASFDMSSQVGVADDLYDGAATIRIGAGDHRVRVRLSGHLDPIDGRYHWQGAIFDALPDDVLTQSQQVTVTIGDRSAAGRVTERTPQGRYSVAGVGTPPYPLEDVEVVLPR